MHLFQVPKGMLQTLHNQIRYLFRNLCFKSPRECYKPVYRCPHDGTVLLSFKSPRECYKREMFRQRVVRESFCFKSPRECYKPYAVPHVMGTAIEFQVPKGMLQTFLAVLCPGGQCCVSSPQGNATNFFTACSNTNTFMQVSSPQGNATNPIFLHLYYCCRGLVSSPQGNATNAKPWHKKKRL